MVYITEKANFVNCYSDNLHMVHDQIEDKLLELKHRPNITTIYNLTWQLLNDSIILARDIQGIIFNFSLKTII